MRDLRRYSNWARLVQPVRCSLRADHKVFGEKSRRRSDQLKFAYLGAAELPASLMNNVVDAYALSPPSAEITEPSGKGYVLIPLGKAKCRN